MTAGHDLDPSILREYDIRGIVGESLNVEDVRAIARGFGTMIAGADAAFIAVGYDGRVTSPALEAALVDGLAACGHSVVRIGRGPTPMLYYAAHVLGADAGLMVTGSHNPPEYNGIKIVSKGLPFYGADIQKLGQVVARGDFAAGQGRVEDRPMAEAYTDRLVEGYTGTGALAVAWDAGNGATGDVLQALTARLPGRHVLLNETIDGTFPAHHPDPTVEANLRQLKDAVRDENCDLGIAFDGDGDRIGVIDSRARVLWGDQLLAILAREVLDAVPGATIIADVKASQVLFDEIARLGGKPLMWRTGHSVIKSKMVETKAPLAGEMSGHIFYAHDYYGYDDAMFAAVRLLSDLGRTGESLAELRDGLPVTVNTPEIRFPCPDALKWAVIDDVRRRLEDAKGMTVNDIDGVRVTSADGWWLLRASNTQPVLVARCESADEDGLQRLKDVLAEQLKLSGIEPPALD
ncbi:MAG: phosphomannomutase/phosphoglucomutase [Rhodospirillales bacterium]|jgi:phosphomannomutase|nr:phosphomannomutase/phosphoglucomutase [Rhodospirillales bacterium]